MVPKSKQKESGFKAVDLSIEIYNDILDLCLKMPNRYTYLILQPILQLAGEIMDNMVTANGIDYSKDDYDLDISTTNYETYTITLKAKTGGEFSNIKIKDYYSNNSDNIKKLGTNSTSLTNITLDETSLKADYQVD